MNRWVWIAVQILVLALAAALAPVIVGKEISWAGALGVGLAGVVMAGVGAVLDWRAYQRYDFPLPRAQERAEKAGIELWGGIAAPGDEL